MNEKNRLNEHVRACLLFYFYLAPGYHVPLITGDFRRNKTALIHDNVTFSCTYISGTLPFEVNWVKHYQKDGKWEDNRSGVQFIQFLAASLSDPFNHHLWFLLTINDPWQIETTPHQQQTDLHLYKVKRKDTGWYSCHVKNRLGVRKADFWLTVTGKEIEMLTIADEIESFILDTISNETRLIERIEVNGAEFWSVVAALCLLAALFMIAVVVVMSYASRKWVLFV